jgi:hypothetical protein
MAAWVLALLIGFAVTADWLGFSVTLGFSLVLIILPADTSMPALDWPGAWRFLRLLVDLIVSFGLLAGGTFALLDGQDFDPLFAFGLGVLFAAGVSALYICAILWTRFARSP